MKRNGTLWPKVLVGFVGVIATIWIVITSLGASATREWERYAAALRAKGQPLTFDEIEAQRAVVPDDQNSARVIEALKDQLDELGKGIDPDILYLGSSTQGDFFTGIPQGRLDKSREFLATQSDLLDKLSAIRDMRTGRFQIAYDKDDPISTLLPSVGHVRAAGKLFRLQGTVAASEKDVAGALSAFELQCRTAGSLSDEPTIVSRLVQIAVQALVVQAAEEILLVGGLDAPSLDRITAELKLIRDSATMRWGFLGERAFFTGICETILNGTMTNHEVCSVTGNCNTFPGNFLRLPKFVTRADQIEGAKLLTSLIDADGNPRAMLDAARNMEQRVKDLSGIYKFVKIMMPSLSRSVILCIKLQAQTDCALAAIAAEKFRLAEGRLPDSLDELVPAFLPAVPTDPFDGKPMRLAKTEQGIVIYSINEDTIDNGGDVARKSDQKSKRATDTGFRLNHPDHRGVVIVEGPADSED